MVTVSSIQIKAGIIAAAISMLGLSRVADLDSFVQNVSAFLEQENVDAQESSVNNSKDSSKSENKSKKETKKNSLVSIKG